MLLMTYNYHGNWNEFTGHHSAMFPRSDEVAAEREWNQVSVELELATSQLWVVFMRLFYKPYMRLARPSVRPSVYEKDTSVPYGLVTRKHKFSWWAPKTHVFWNRVRNGCSGSSKVIDFGTNRNRVCNLQLVISSNFGSILPRFRDIAGFLLRTATPGLFQSNFGGIPFGLDCRCCGSEERRP